MMVPGSDFHPRFSPAGRGGSKTARPTFSCFFDYANSLSKANICGDRLLLSTVSNLKAPSLTALHSITSCQLIGNVIAVVLLCLWLPVCYMPAQADTAWIHGPASSDQTPENGNSRGSMTLGFAGKAKLGHWTPVRFSLPPEIKAERFEITCLDSDESPVTYSGSLHRVDTSQQTADPSHRIFQGLIRLGRRFGSVAATLRDSQGQIVFETTLDLASVDANEIAVSTQYLSVAMTGSIPLMKQFRPILAGDASDTSKGFVTIDSPRQLPAVALGWQSVDRLIIGGDANYLFSQATDHQWQAIADWVQQGGQLVILADPEHPEFYSQKGPLKNLIPGKLAGIQQMTTSRDLERLVGASRRRLIGRDDPPIDFLGIDFNGRAAASVGDYPLLIEVARGFGQITVLTMDIESPRLANWTSYDQLFNRVVLGAGQGGRGVWQSNRPANATNFGFEDLVGQLRVPLDNFQNVRFIAFTVVAVLISFYILCVSLGDYFLLRKFSSKMEMTWFTFPIIALLFCGLAYLVASFTRPSSMQISQMEIIDVDFVQQQARGTSWVHIYSPDSQRVDVTVEPETAFGQTVQSSVVSWQGLPGEGLGGMANEVSAGFQRIGYQQTIHQITAGNSNDVAGNSNDAAATAANKTTGPPATQVSMDQVPLQVASTRPLLIQYAVDCPLGSPGKLTTDRDRLTGTFSNPFSTTLYNGKIFFGDYVYLLKKPLPPGSIILLESDAKERTARSYLNRSSAQGTDANEGSRSQNQPWDPQETNLVRIADMLMFHQSAGGSEYTGLTHGYHRELDFSHLLKLNRAIFVGQLESGSRLSINQTDSEHLYDSKVSMIRLVLPVE